ncbi:zinc finger protein interacting with ribonucleoprotein K-like [Microplitis mediator]|uniref:zinc finger protein interacting with ribonucleoprotein K-like n=1 Tax=Microplitis mediator TaxID=375433 RepID=UPI0025540FE5|nr:zinc finger protein interacting with ribonucleoprotein K-like [Microplitis mediator]
MDCGDGQRNWQKNQDYSVNLTTGRYHCPACNWSYTRRDSMLAHYRYECGKPPRFKCPYCQLYILPSVMMNVKRRHQQNIFGGRSGYSVLPLMKNLASMWMVKQRSQFSYRCDQCGKGYQHRATLVRHTRHECGKEPQFKCPYCAHRTKQKGNLYQHIRNNHPGKNVFTSTD